ncbi:hypothetical protein Tco_0742807 [Tanacetum coccineum]
MSLPNLECFKFKIEPDPGDLTSIDLGIRKNVSTTNVNVPLEDDQSSLFAYVVMDLIFPIEIALVLHSSTRISFLSFSLENPVSKSNRLEHPSETIVFHNEDGNPARANIKQALGYRKDGDRDGKPHKGVKASANSDVKYSFTSAQDGEPLQDDVRLCLGNDLKKAQDHSQRHV